VQSSGGGSFDLAVDAQPVIGILVALSSMLPYTLTEEMQIDILSKARDDYGSSESDSLLSLAMQAIRSYVNSLC